MDRKTHWDEVWSARAEDAVSWFQPDPRLSLDLIARAGLGPGASAIDVGGGASRLVDALLERGWSDLAVLDLSAAALERSRARLGAAAGRVRWIEADVAAWRPDRRWALWHDRAVFHFLTEAADRAAYADALRAATAPGAAVIVATFAPDGPERCSGLPVVRYAPEALLAALGPGLELVEAANEDHVTPGGKTQRFQFCRFRRA